MFTSGQQKESEEGHLKCPLCDQRCNYDHIINDHREFWNLKFPTEQLPTTVDLFNNRFGMIGLHIEELK